MKIEKLPFKITRSKDIFKKRTVNTQSAKSHQNVPENTRLNTNYSEITQPDKYSSDVIKQVAQRNKQLDKISKYAHAAGYYCDNQCDILDELIREIKNSQIIAIKFMSKFGYDIDDSNMNKNFHNALVCAKAAQEQGNSASRVFFVDGDKYCSKLETSNETHDTVLSVKNIDTGSTMEFMKNPNDTESNEKYSLVCITTNNRKIWLSNSLVTAAAVDIGYEDKNKLSAKKYYRLTVQDAYPQAYVDYNTTIDLKNRPYIDMYANSINPQARFEFSSQTGSLISSEID